jgi:hypothetical protein
MGVGDVFQSIELWNMVTISFVGHKTCAISPFPP